MVLADRDIKEELEKGKLIIKPLDLETQLGPASIDLRLGNRFRVFKPTDKEVIDPLNFKDEVKKEWINDKDNKHVEHEYTTLFVADRPFILHPREFLLASIHEYIEIPDYLMGSLDGRSSLGRLGLVVHSTAGSVDPGYRGHLTLELSNVGKLPIKLHPEMRICRLVLQRMKSSAEVPYYKKKGAKYVDEEGSASSKIDSDEDLANLRK